MKKVFLLTFVMCLFASIGMADDGISTTAVTTTVEAAGTSTLTVILAAALAVSEALALIPSLKANSILQAIMNALKALVGK